MPQSLREGCEEDGGPEACGRPTRTWGAEAPFLRPPPLDALPSESPLLFQCSIFLKNEGFLDPYPSGNSTQMGQPFSRRHTVKRRAKPGLRPNTASPRFTPSGALGSLYPKGTAPSGSSGREPRVLDPQSSVFPGFACPAWPSLSRWHLAGWVAAALRRPCGGHGVPGPASDSRRKLLLVKGSHL